MSVIIRLQNLPWAASAADIRQYFQGLSIPEGGVHIVGGEQGDAFIAFSTDEDARMAMLSDGGCIKEVKVKLLLSSRNEMQKVIETARQQALNLQTIMQMPAQHPMMNVVPPLTAKVLPQPQQPIMPQQIIMHQQQMQMQMQPNHEMIQLQKSNSPIKDHDREHRSDRTRSKSRERRSKSSRIGSRRDRSRSRDRRRRDRSRGRDRSRERHRGSKDSLSRDGGKSQRSKSPPKKDDLQQKQQQPVKPWATHFDGGNASNVPMPLMDSNSRPAMVNMGGRGVPGIDPRNQSIAQGHNNMYGQFRTPQPPTIPPMYQTGQNQQAFTDEYDNDNRPYDDNINGNFDSRYHNGDESMGRPRADFGRRFNDVGPHQRRHGFQQQSGDIQNNRGPRFGKGGPSGMQMNRPYGGDNAGGPPASRFNHDRQSMFEDHSPQKFNDDGPPPLSSDYNEQAKKPRFNDRYRYDVRNSAQHVANLQQPTEGLCVEVYNMSNHISYGDVRKMFDGIQIDGSAIKIQKHKQGVAFVKFNDNHSKNMAMKYNGTLYKGNRIIIKHLDDEAYEKENTDDRPYPKADNTGIKSTAVNGDDQPDVLIIDGDDRDDSDDLIVCENVNDDSKIQQTSSTKYLKLNQVPITVTEDEVRTVINVDTLRTVEFFPDDQFLGVILEFTSVEAAESTLKQHDCVLLGFSPIPLLPCTDKEARRLIKRRPPPPSSHKPVEKNNFNNRHPPYKSLHSNCLYLSGLPTTVTNTDITQFFSDVSVLPDKIHIMLNKFGRPTGESYCEFGNAQQAYAAAAKDQCFMGPCIVSVEMISRSDMIQAITKPMQDMSWGMRGGPRQNMMPPQGNHAPYHNPNNGLPNYMNRPQYMNNRGNMGHPYTPRMRTPGPGPSPGPDSFGQPGCVVALDNVPYRADVQEIVEFFDGFDLNSQNVIRRFNDFGKPTGEARVNLRSPQEAMNAVKMLQNKSIHNRPIRLTHL
ncbi:uncharacterized protein LOC126906174 [Daktulosphaira vitifoliae]|uniref:uncharacterized protein LOC126906174 n=1 Tax=Daktulosphaira vitifoliae TaxID=58002 RepID=UPI0021AA826B|nr:uncharacterized protein LOC126906174 [Daktulosphaira vitifoliae]XP_050542471.1 uncharacterized protein LOC126906174 [Daktulosphaira vitifoliae]